MVTLVNNSFSRDEEAKRASDVLKVKEERGKIALLSFQIPLHFSLQHFSLLYHVSNISYFFQIRGILSWCMSTFPNLEAHCLTDARSYIAADPTESWRSVSHWGYSMPRPCHATTLCWERLALRAAGTEPSSSCLRELPGDCKEMVWKKMSMHTGHTPATCSALTTTHGKPS